MYFFHLLLRTGMGRTGMGRLVRVFSTDAGSKDQFDHLFWKMSSCSREVVKINLTIGQEGGQL